MILEYPDLCVARPSRISSNVTSSASTHRCDKIAYRGTSPPENSSKRKDWSCSMRRSRRPDIVKGQKIGRKRGTCDPNKLSQGKAGLTVAVKERDMKQGCKLTERSFRQMQRCPMVTRATAATRLTMTFERVVRNAWLSVMLRLNILIRVFARVLLVTGIYEFIGDVLMGEGRS